MRVLKFPQPKLSQFWGPITLRTNLWLKWGLKKSCSPRQDISNGMSHTTYMQGNWGDSRPLVVKSQITNLIPNLSFGHNLYLRYPNGSCEPILDIHIPIAFQWYDELFNPLGFGPCNCSMKIRKSIGTPTPKVGAPLGVWRVIPSHFLTFPGARDVTSRLPFWPMPLQALALVASPRLRLRQAPLHL
jgi:hypothetical protein